MTTRRKGRRCTMRACALDGLGRPIPRTCETRTIVVPAHRRCPPSPDGEARAKAARAASKQAKADDKARAKEAKAQAADAAEQARAKRQAESEERLAQKREERDARKGVVRREKREETREEPAAPSTARERLAERKREREERAKAEAAEREALVPRAQQMTFTMPDDDDEGAVEEDVAPTSEEVEAMRARIDTSSRVSPEARALIQSLRNKRGGAFGIGRASKGKAHKPCYKAPRKAVKRGCSEKSFLDNIRHFRCVEKKSIQQSVAIAFSLLHKGCDVPRKKGVRMKSSEIILRGKRKRARKKRKASR